MINFTPLPQTLYPYALSECFHSESSRFSCCVVFGTHISSSTHLSRIIMYTSNLALSPLASVMSILDTWIDILDITEAHVHVYALTRKHTHAAISRSTLNICFISGKLMFFWFSHDYLCRGIFTVHAKLTLFQYSFSPIILFSLSSSFGMVIFILFPFLCTHFLHWTWHIWHVCVCLYYLRFFLSMRC